MVAHDDQGPRPRARGADRRAGGGDGQGRAAGDLRLGVAGGRGREPRRPDLPGSVAVSGQQRSDRRPQDQQRAATRGPDRVVGRRHRHLLDGAGRRRRRGRFRRRAQRVRAHEGADRERRGRRPLRGPAREREEVRAPRRQGAGPHVPVRPDARRRAAGRRRPGRARRCSWRGPTPSPPRCSRATWTRSTGRSSRADRTARGLLPDPERRRDRDRPRARVRAVRRRAVVRDVDPGPGGSSGVRRGDPRARSPASCSPTTARRASTGASTWTTPRSPASSASSGRWATASSSSRSPGSTR